MGNSNIFTWMYRIATNESLSFLGKKARQLGISNEEWIEKQVENLETDVFFDGDEMQLKLQNIIATLPEKQRLVFNMRYFEEMKYEKMSEILETSVLDWSLTKWGYQSNTSLQVRTSTILYQAT